MHASTNVNKQIHDVYNSYKSSKQTITWLSYQIILYKVFESMFIHLHLAWKTTYHKISDRNNLRRRVI